MKLKTGLLILAACTVYLVRADGDDVTTIAVSNASDGSASNKTIPSDGGAAASNNDDSRSNAEAAATVVTAVATSDDDKTTVTAGGTAESTSDTEDSAASSIAAVTAAVSEGAIDISPTTFNNAFIKIATATSDCDDNGTPIGFIHENRIICICKLSYDPVCGSNGVTYSNDCVLNCVSNDELLNKRPPIHKLHRGECPKTSCNCPKIDQPLCGSNNETYVNDCYLACDNARRAQAGVAPVTIAYRGICRRAAVCSCPDSVIPVCGTDGKTYRNVCILQCYSYLKQIKSLPAIDVRSNGTCKIETCNCPQRKKQICASDGNTYFNYCTFVCENRRLNQLGLDPLTIQYPGKCKNCICPLNLDPVCASDSKTYSNNCSLECENEKRRRVGLLDLIMHWRGPCNCGCTWEWLPVCASDQKTWANRCQFQCENKKRALTGLPQLTVLHVGECIECNCDSCPKLYQPVCGSDGQTYRNICFLKCNSDCRLNCGLSPLRKITDLGCS